MKKEGSQSLLQVFTQGFVPALAIVQNAIEYRLRQLIKWRKGLPYFENESKEDLFVHLPEKEQKQANEVAKWLFTNFHLQHLYENSSAENYRVNLFYTEMLCRALSEAAPQMPPTIHAADIGVSDWVYVQALYAVLKWWNSSSGRAVRLTGYEADAYRVCTCLFSRYDLAHGHMRGLEGVQYIPHKFTQQPDEFDVIMMLFPFVFLADHLGWGLPLRRFKPVELLRDAWASLKPGGLLVIVNQGQAEHYNHRKMLIRENIQPAAAFQHLSLLYKYDLIRCVLVAIRDA